MNTDISEKHVFKIIEDYFKNHGFVRHQIDSYNKFIFQDLQRIISEEPDIGVEKNTKEKFKVHFGEVHITKPTIIEENRVVNIVYPNKARNEDLYYETGLHVDIMETLTGEDDIIIERNIHKRVLIAKIPVMVQSSLCNLSSCTPEERITNGECEYDRGGYFVVKGKERVLIGQIHGVYNQVICLAQKPGDKYKFVAEIRSMSEETGHSVLVQVKITQDDKNIVLSLPYIKETIPVGVVFKALGYIDEKQIIDMIGLEGEKVQKYLKNIIRDSYFISSQEDALKYLGQFSMHIIKEEKRRDYAWQVVDTELFPHLGVTATIKEKVYFLGQMVNKLLSTNIGRRCEDDRDNYTNKRIEMSGVLMAELFRTLFKRYVKALEQQLEKKKFNPEVMSIIPRNNTITTGLRTCLQTGNWGITKNSYMRTGVSQVLSRLTYGATLSHLRRIAIPIGKEGKNSKIRQIHPSQIMFVCPCECFDPDTPVWMWDGSVKLAKNITVGDRLIDDNGEPTTVKSVVSGESEMFEIIPDKRNFMSHTVTSNHILTLKCDYRHKEIKENKQAKGATWTVLYFDKNEIKLSRKTFKLLAEAQLFADTIADDTTVDISLQQYLKLPNDLKKHMKLFKTSGINWPKKDVKIDPYVLGMWLGDGSSDGSGFACNYKEDQVLVDQWIEWGKNNDATIKRGRRYNHDIISTINASYQIGERIDKKGRTVFKQVTEPHPLRKVLKHYNLVKNKHIPNDYLVNDRETRLRLLAGLVDTDGSIRFNGHEIRICQGPANTNIIFQTEQLAQSLGLCTHINTGRSQWTDAKSGDKKFSTYTELTITGEKLYEIPTLLPRKKIDRFTLERSVKRSQTLLKSSFTVTEKGVGKFNGWQLNENQRFVLGDGVTSHNSPEGQSAGIVLNLALLTHVTARIPTIVVKEIVERSDNMTLINEYEGPNNQTRVFLNGILLGITEDPDSLLEELKSLRIKGLLHKSISITYNEIDDDVHVFSDDGRLFRPLFTMTDGRLNIKESDGSNWDELVDKNLIEYLDNSEVESSVLAMTFDDIRKYHADYCEIHPSMILGVMASIVPFAANTQSPRVIYQCIDPDELVLMGDYTKKKIKDIVVGDEVVSVNPVTYSRSITKVINHYVKETDKDVITIFTVTGRSLTCTEDHPILTSKGWRKASEAEDVCVLIEKRSVEHRQQYYKSRTLAKIRKWYNHYREDVDQTDHFNASCCGFMPYQHTTFSSFYFSMADTATFDKRTFDAVRSMPITRYFARIVKKILRPEKKIIADITTESENHSFVAGGSFVVHNSSMGRWPK